MKKPCWIICVVLTLLVLGTQNICAQTRAKLQRKELRNMGGGGAYPPPSRNYGSSSQGDVGGKVADVVGNTFDHFGQGAMGAMSVETIGYPCVQIQCGFSHIYRNFLRAKLCLGGQGGFALYGGVGRDIVIFKTDKDWTSWHVGLGYYYNVADRQDVSFGISWANSPLARKDWQKGSLNLDATYSYFLGKSQYVGLFAGVGFGITAHDVDKTKGKMIGEYKFGLAVKLWQKRRRTAY